VQVGAFTGFGGEVLEGFSLQLSTSAGQLQALTFASASQNGIAGTLRAPGSNVQSSTSMPATQAGCSVPWISTVEWMAAVWRPRSTKG
jgi:hypothetical protein